MNSFNASQSSQWNDYRRKAVTDLVRETKNLIQSVKPNISLTAAVKPNLYQARERFFQEWDVWLAAGYLDKAIAMNYTKDLKDFGLIPEIIGRLPVLTYMNPLDESTLRAILTEPKNSLTKQFSKLFEMEDVELDIREDALSEIAKKAIERKTGARGLRSILEHILMETMYKVPSEESLNKVVLDGSVVKGESEPLMVYEKSSKTKTG